MVGKYKITQQNFDFLFLSTVRSKSLRIFLFLISHKKWLMAEHLSANINIQDMTKIPQVCRSVKSLVWKMLGDKQCGTLACPNNHPMKHQHFCLKNKSGCKLLTYNP